MKNIDKKERADAHRGFHKKEFPADTFHEEEVIYCNLHIKMWKQSRKSKKRGKK